MEQTWQLLAKLFSSLYQSHDKSLEHNYLNTHKLQLHKTNEYTWAITTAEKET
jgi:hypothetical protein